MTLSLHFHVAVLTGNTGAMAIQPTAEQITRYLGVDRKGPVVMVNVLRFKSRAEGEDGTGADAYARYGDVARETVAAVGGRFLWAGRVESLVIGDDDTDRYDMVALVEYPSREAILEMAQRPDYQQGHTHREAGLECQLLIACEAIEDHLRG